MALPRNPAPTALGDGTDDESGAAEAACSGEGRAVSAPALAGDAPRTRTRGFSARGSSDLSVGCRRRDERQLEDTGVHEAVRGAVDLLLEVAEDLLGRVLLRCPVPPSGCGLVTVLRGSLVLRMLVPGRVEVADEEDPGPAGARLQVGKELAGDAGLDLGVPAALDLDDDGEWLGGTVAGVGRLDVEVGPAAVDAGRARSLPRG